VWIGPRRRGLGRTPLERRLPREPLLRLAAESHGRRLLDEYLERERVRVLSTIEVTSVSLMLSYVSGGLGIGLAPALALDEVPRGRVVIEPAHVPSQPVKLVSRPSTRRSAVAVQFAAEVAAEGRRAGERLARRQPR
jgi:DNA-binding transcriptional LysR family regulator